MSHEFPNVTGMRTYIPRYATPGHSFIAPVYRRPVFKTWSVLPTPPVRVGPHPLRPFFTFHAQQPQRSNVVPSTDQKAKQGWPLDWPKKGSIPQQSWPLDLLTGSVAVRVYPRTTLLSLLHRECADLCDRPRTTSLQLLPQIVNQHANLKSLSQNPDCSASPLIRIDPVS